VAEQVPAGQPDPDLLPADAAELVAGQYADRPRLRPVLDAVLAALPALGPVTVRARKTFVSLVTPELGQLTVLIEGFALPGRVCAAADGGQHRNMHIGLASKSKDGPGLDAPGHPWRVTGPVPGDAPSARWAAQVTVRRGTDGLDFSGPNVRGDRTDRHLFLAHGDVRDDGTLRLVSGSKLKLGLVDPGVIEDAMRPGHRLLARIRLSRGPSGGRGLTWSAGLADAEPR
jgi:Family of unknown function (DUF5990)